MSKIRTIHILFIAKFFQKIKKNKKASVNEALIIHF